MKESTLYVGHSFLVGACFAGSWILKNTLKFLCHLFAMSPKILLQRSDPWTGSDH